MNYALFAVASLRSKRAPFPLNKSPNPDNVRSGMQWCFALHAVYVREFITNFKIYERAYHASKFSGKQ